jgi:NCS1 family nucleobase:cation symporter-1
MLALIALFLGILPNVPGFLTTVGLLSPGAVWPWVSALYNYAWFIGFFVSGLSYLILMRSLVAAPSKNIHLEEQYVTTH